MIHIFADSSIMYTALNKALTELLGENADIVFCHIKSLNAKIVEMSFSGIPVIIYGFEDQRMSSFVGKKIAYIAHPFNKEGIMDVYKSLTEKCTQKCPISINT